MIKNYKPKTYTPLSFFSVYNWNKPTKNQVTSSSFKITSNKIGMRLPSIPTVSSQSIPLPARLYVVEKEPGKKRGRPKLLVLSKHEIKTKTVNNFKPSKKSATNVLAVNTLIKETIKGEENIYKMLEKAIPEKKGIGKLAILNRFAEPKPEEFEVESTNKIKEVALTQVERKTKNQTLKMVTALNEWSKEHAENLIERLPDLLGRPLTDEEIELLDFLTTKMDPVDQYAIIGKYAELAEAYFESDSSYQALDDEIIDDESIKAFFDEIKEYKENFEKIVKTETGYN